MNRIYFTIPYINALKTQDGWNHDPSSDTYFVVRCHYLLKERQLTDPTKKGEIAGASTSLRGITQKKTHSSEYEFTSLNLEDSIKESLVEEESVKEFISSLSSSLGADKVARLSSEIKSNVKTQLKESFKSTFKVQISETFREKKTVVWEYTVDPDKFGPNETIVAVKAYKRYAFDLYLVFFDYLFIEYKRPLYGVKLRRKKLPPVLGKNHPNIVRLDLPLASILFWRQIPDSLLLVNETDYRIEVDDPLETTTVELNDYRKYPARIPPKPSLYELSENVFPKKKWL